MTGPPHQWPVGIRSASSHSRQKEPAPGACRAGAKQTSRYDELHLKRNAAEFPAVLGLQVGDVAATSVGGWTDGDRTPSPPPRTVTPSPTAGWAGQAVIERLRPGP
jgi:hypothetical protein